VLSRELDVRWAAARRVRDLRERRVLRRGGQPRLARSAATAEDAEEENKTMSWGTIRKGTREQVTAEISADFENFTKNYPRGTNEGEDVEVARMRCLALLATIDMSVDAYFEDDVVQASANGSHSWSGDKEKPRTANFTVKVERVPRVQKQ
jgi:hypothetical protein